MDQRKGIPFRFLLPLTPPPRPLHPRRPIFTAMSTHEFLEHIGETRLRLQAASLESLLAEAAVALGEVELAGIPLEPGHLERQIEVAAVDTGALLVDWLNELIYLAESEACVPVSAEVRLTAPSALEARVTCQRLSRPPALVKAATHHGLRLARVTAGWEAEVILDV